jgi:tol-pal system protein YbgF
MRGAAGWALLVAGLFTVTGCATKKDVRTLQGELLAMRARQDSATRVLQRENRMLLDSLRKAMNITQDASGQTSHRFQQLEATLAETQGLVAQVMQMGQELAARLDAFGTQQQGGLRPGGVSAAGGGDAEEYYTAGTEKMAEGAYGTARLAFQQLLREFHDHARAPDAQFQVGETYAGEKNYEQAVRELEVVAEEWPNSERAPQALYRAGIIAADSLSPKQPRKARELLQRVVDTYRDSPSAGPARTKLGRLPRS